MFQIKASQNWTTWAIEKTIKMFLEKVVLMHLQVHSRITVDNIFMFDDEKERERDLSGCPVHVFIES